MKVIKKMINNIPVTFIKTKKFKSIAGALYFTSSATNEKITTRALLRDILIYNTKKYPTNEELNINCLENYDAYYGVSSSRTGNSFTNSFCFRTLEDEYTKKGNLKKVIDTFCEIIFNPNVKNNGFDKKSFETRQKKIKESYEKLKENQRAYAEHRILNYLNQNKAYSYKLSLETLNKITPESLYEEYLDMINNSYVSLIIVGNVDENDSVYEKIPNNIKTNIKYHLDLYINNDDEKEKENVKETANGTQNVLQLIYYLKNMNHYELNYVMPIYKMILGGGGSSRLFDSVREKNSLAYYCFARYEKDDNILEVITGIEKENYEKAIKIIKEEKDKMSSISEEELENAKKELVSSLLESQDNIFNVMGRKRTEDVFNLPSIEEYLEKLNDVNKEEVENINKKVQLGLCYFLQGSDNNE